jgi:hypothetical protein
MKFYTGWEYLLIDVANAFGLDKLRFEERIQWAKDNLDNLEDLGESKPFWKQKPLYQKATMAIRRAQKGEPIGHLVGLDAVCSGMQIMSALTGCHAGATATGLVDPDRRADAYSDCTALMVEELGYHIEGERSKVKNATMTSLYGSKLEPKKEFGEDTPELTAFYKAMYRLAPGACDLLQALLDSWNPGALRHAWRLPDGFFANVKVMQRVEKRLEVDELDHSTFTYTYYINQGEEKGVKNAANVIHSIDGYILRSLLRRCNYDAEAFAWAQAEIEIELLERSFGKSPTDRMPPNTKTWYYQEQCDRSGMADPVIIPHLASEEGSIQSLTTEHLLGLAKIIESCMGHKPFPVVTVHDDFKAHPNNLNWLRLHYRNILAEMSESTMLNDILGQLYGRQGNFKMRSHDLADKIRQSNYALC